MGVVGVVGGVGDGGVGPAMQMLGLNPPLSGVHLSTPSEYIPLQHPFMHWEFDEHCSQSPSDPVVGEVGVVGMVGVVGVVGGGDGGVGALVHGPFWQHAPQWSTDVPHH